MNWDDYRLFLSVCRRPRLEDAAAAAGLDPTTLSRRVKRLETSLGATLFERSRRGHHLTTYGEKLFSQIEGIEGLVLEIESTSASAQVLSGRVRLGAPEGLGTTVLAPAMFDFKRSYPNIEIDLVALSGFVSVPKRQADMSILLTRPKTGRLKVRKLWDYDLRLYGSSDYVASHDPVEKRSDLYDHALVGYTEDLIYSSELRYFQDLLPNVVPGLCSPSIVAQTKMVAAGVGLGILPTFMAEREDNLVELLSEDIKVERTFWLSIHADIASVPRIRMLVEFLTNLQLMPVQFQDQSPASC
ncbi:MAG: LysR family transcriptional regulator [Pseudomonadota bacterium]